MRPCGLSQEHTRWKRAPEEGFADGPFDCSSGASTFVAPQTEEAVAHAMKRCRVTVGLRQSPHGRTLRWVGITCFNSLKQDSVPS